MITNYSLPKSITACIILLLAGSMLRAQTSLPDLQQSKVGSAGANYQFWHADRDQVQQLSLPVTFVFPVNERLRLDVATSPAFSGIETGGTANLGGPSDTRISGSYLLGDEKFLLTFGVNVPSGKSSLKPEEFSVANILALHALDFQTPILGQGVDMSGGLVMAQRLSDFVFGIGAGYLMRGGFKPVFNSDYEYNPGDELSFSLGVDRPLTRRSKLMFDGSYTLYSEDVANGTAVFKSGNRITFQALYYTSGEFMTYVFSVRNRMQSKNEMGSGTLIPERENSNSNELELNGIASFALSSKASLRGALEGKLYSDNAYKRSGATVGGIGGGLSKSLGSSLVFDADFRFYLGKLNVGTREVNLLGGKVFGGFKIYL